MRALALILVGVATAACAGSSAPVASTAASPTPHSLSGIGATWQVVATLDGNVSGIALDGHGHLYAVEYEANQIVELSTTGATVTRWGSAGSGSAQFSQPIRVALDAQGNVYVSDSNNNRVQKFSPAGQPLAQFGALGDGPGQFNFPVGVAVDTQGDIYVGDAKNGRVQKLSPAGAPLAQWGGIGDAPGQFHGVPGDVAVDSHGNVFVTEAYGFNRVHEFSRQGTFVTSWGGTGEDPGSFNEPRGIAFDGQGDLYVGDTGNNRVEELTPAGKFIAEWGGPSSSLFVEQTDIALDDAGHLYASDGKLILETCVIKTGCG